MHNMKSFLCLTPLLLVWSFILAGNRDMKECRFSKTWTEKPVFERFMPYILSVHFHEDWISRIRLDLGRTVLW